MTLEEVSDENVQSTLFVKIIKIGLTIKNAESTRVLIGIVSFGAESGCEKGYPTVMTFITPYIEWIHNKTNISLK